MDIKWYTGTGDDGYTGVLGHERVPKYADRPDAYGTADEASAILGMARVQAKDKQVRQLILAIQRDLYKLMADLATLPEAATRPPWLGDERLTWLEQKTDALGKRRRDAAGVHHSGDSVGGAWLDIARTVVRRAERIVAKLTHDGEMRNDTPLKYLNRLSSLLFVMARVEDKAEGVEQFTLAAEDEVRSA